MKHLLLVALVLAPALSWSDEIWTVNGKPVSKGDAVRAAATDPDAKIQRITDMKLSDKGTLIKK